METMQNLQPEVLEKWRRRLKTQILLPNNEVPQISKMNEQLTTMGITPKKFFQEPDRIEDKLWVGGLNAGQDTLTNGNPHQFTHLVCIMTPKETPPVYAASLNVGGGEHVKCLVVEVEDGSDQAVVCGNTTFITKLKPFLDEAMDTIPKPFQPPTKILIHCRMGVNRSCTVIAAYLIGRFNYTLWEAVSKVVTERRFCFANRNLRDDLIHYASDLGKLDETPVNEDDFELKKYLGNGVYLCTGKELGKSHGVIRLEKEGGDLKFESTMAKELKEITREGVPISTRTDPMTKRRYALMPYCPGESLYTILRRRNTSAQTKAKFLMEAFAIARAFEKCGQCFSGVWSERLVLMTQPNRDVRLRIVEYGPVRAGEPRMFNKDWTFALQSFAFFVLELCTDCDPIFRSYVCDEKRDANITLPRAFDLIQSLAYTALGLKASPATLFGGKDEDYGQIFNEIAAVVELPAEILHPTFDEAVLKFSAMTDYIQRQKKFSESIRVVAKEIADRCKDPMQLSRVLHGMARSKTCKSNVVLFYIDAILRAARKIDGRFEPIVKAFVAPMRPTNSNGGVAVSDSMVENVVQRVARETRGSGGEIPPDRLESAEKYKQIIQNWDRMKWLPGLKDLCGFFTTVLHGGEKKKMAGEKKKEKMESRKTLELFSDMMNEDRDIQTAQLVQQTCVTSPVDEEIHFNEGNVDEEPTFYTPKETEKKMVRAQLSIQSPRKALEMVPTIDVLAGKNCKVVNVEEDPLVQSVQSKSTHKHVPEVRASLRKNRAHAAPVSEVEEVETNQAIASVASERGDSESRRVHPRKRAKARSRQRTHERRSRSRRGRNKHSRRKRCERKRAPSPSVQSKTVSEDISVHRKSDRKKASGKKQCPDSLRESETVRSRHRWANSGDEHSHSAESGTDVPDKSVEEKQRSSVQSSQTEAVPSAVGDKGQSDTEQDETQRSQSAQSSASGSGTVAERVPEEEPRSKSAQSGGSESSRSRKSLRKAPEDSARRSKSAQSESSRTRIQSKPREATEVEDDPRRSQSKHTEDEVVEEKERSRSVHSASESGASHKQEAAEVAPPAEDERRSRSAQSDALAPTHSKQKPAQDIPAEAEEEERRSKSAQSSGSESGSNRRKQNHTEAEVVAAEEDQRSKSAQSSGSESGRNEKHAEAAPAAEERSSSGSESGSSRKRRRSASNASEEVSQGSKSASSSESESAPRRRHEAVTRAQSKSAGSSDSASKDREKETKRRADSADSDTDTSSSREKKAATAKKGRLDERKIPAFRKNSSTLPKYNQTRHHLDDKKASVSRVGKKGSGDVHVRSTDGGKLRKAKRVVEATSESESESESVQSKTRRSKKVREPSTSSAETTESEAEASEKESASESEEESEEKTASEGKASSAASVSESASASESASSKSGTEKEESKSGVNTRAKDRSLSAPKRGESRRRHSRSRGGRKDRSSTARNNKRIRRSHSRGGRKERTSTVRDPKRAHRTRSRGRKERSSEARDNVRARRSRSRGRKEHSSAGHDNKRTHRSRSRGARKERSSADRDDQRARRSRSHSRGRKERYARGRDSRAAYLCSSKQVHV